MTKRNMIHKRKCEICDKKINAIVETQYCGRGDNRMGVRRHELLFSKDGLMFGKTWFCNECWELIIENKKGGITK